MSLGKSARPRLKHPQLGERLIASGFLEKSMQAGLFVLIVPDLDIRIHSVRCMEEFLKSNLCWRIAHYTHS